MSQALVPDEPEHGFVEEDARGFGDDGVVKSIEPRRFPLSDPNLLVCFSAVGTRKSHIVSGEDLDPEDPLELFCHVLESDRLQWVAQKGRTGRTLR